MNIVKDFTTAVAPTSIRAFAREKKDIYILSNDFRLARDASGSSRVPRPAFAALSELFRLFGALLGISVGFLASLERFAFELGLSEPDFARRGSP